MDLSIYNSGAERCESSHAYGPAVRKGYLIHYITAGRGVYEVGDKRYELHAGQGFLIFPGVVTRYEADKDEPWEYAWVGFRGADAPELIRRTGMSEEHPYFEAGPVETLQKCLMQIYHDLRAMPDAASGELAAAGGVLRFIALIASRDHAPARSADTYYEKAMWYIHAHLEHAIKIEEIAAFVGLSRSQLFRAFRQAAGISPKEALDEARISQAQVLLRTTSLPLAQIASSCGYANAAHFSAAFRRACGHAPSQERFFLIPERM